MSIFFLLSAALVVLVLALLLPLLAQRDQTTDDIDRQQLNVSIARTQLDELKARLDDGELSNSEFELERERLERDLAGDLAAGTETRQQAGGEWMLWPVAALVPIAAGFIYLTIGTPEAINLPPAHSERQGQVAGNQPAPDMNDVVRQIQQRLAEQPEDARGWFMLGRAHMTMGQFDDAVVAIRRSLQLSGDQPEILIRLADAIAMSQQGSMAGEPEPLLTRALAMEPQNPQGLWLLGMAQSERGDNTAAIATWNSLLPLLAGDPRSENEVRQLIERARQQGDATASGAVDSVSAGANASTAVSAGNADQSSTQRDQLTVSVTVADAMAVDLPADTTVFVYAKAASGPPMPLAVARRTLADLPFTVTLTDADAMMPAMRLSQFAEVSVGARISLSGDAIAQSGDLYGEIAVAEDDEVSVEISSVVQ